ncbi:MAG: hypothetical protein WCE62_18050 [Polyangiales bacterium]
MRWMLLGMLFSVSGCFFGQDGDKPGEAVGSFEAEGAMVVQSCGGAIPAPDPLDLPFDLRLEPSGRAYWLGSNGKMLVGIEKDGVYTFQVGQSWTVIEPNRAQGYVGCSVTQLDELTFELETAELEAEADAGVGPEPDSGADAGVEPTVLTLSGSQTTEIVPVAGSDCVPAVSNQEGSFNALPCRIEYLVTGTGIAAE